MLEDLDGRGLSNHVLVITRWWDSSTALARCSSVSFSPGTSGRQYRITRYRSECANAVLSDVSATECSAFLGGGGVADMPA